jgi:[ribosomal protein S5]-alanine N-acetyltransferase
VSRNLTTQNLQLRPFLEDDAEAYWPLVSLPEVIRYSGDEAQSTLEGVRPLLVDRPIRDYATYGFGRMACIEKSSGRLVGFSGLKYLENLSEVDVGYRFLPESWGKGYATESARALIRQGAEEFGIRRVIGMVHADNTGSVRVLEKLGLELQHTVRPEGWAVDALLYATVGTGPEDAYGITRRQSVSAAMR